MKATERLDWGAFPRPSRLACHLLMPAWAQVNASECPNTLRVHHLQAGELTSLTRRFGLEEGTEDGRRGMPWHAQLDGHHAHTGRGLRPLACQLHCAQSFTSLVPRSVTAAAR